MSGDLCMLCSFGASQRVFRDVNEKVEGRYSVRVESRSIIGGLIVNGTVTTGRVIAPSPTPSIGFNMSVPDNGKFHQTISAVPDSLVFWAKYNITDDSDSAMVSFFIHGEEDLKDPDHRREATQVISKVQQTFHTSGKWQRIAIEFKGSLSPYQPEYILATFSSSFKAGKGNGNAKLWVDDIQLVYRNELSDAIR